MHQSCSGIDTHISMSEYSCLFHESIHHDFVDFPQIIYLIGVQLRSQLICLVRIFHFLDILRRTEDPFPVNDIRHLMQRQRILLDGKRKMNRPNPILPLLNRIRMQRLIESNTTNIFTNLYDQVGDFFRHTERRDVFFHPCILTTLEF